MRFLNKSFGPSILALGLAAFVFSCGKTSSTDQAASTPTPTPTVVATEAPETSALAFWLASNPKDSSLPVAVRYDGTGRLSLTIDLFESGLDLGPITAFHFFDNTTLMFFIDPGLGKETIGTLDIKTALVKNKAWGGESSIKEALKGNRASSLVTGLQSGVLYAQIPSGVKSIRYNNDGGLSAEDFFVGTSAAATACPIGTVTSSALVQGGGKSFLALTNTTTATRINVVNVGAGIANCVTSFDYSQGPETTAQHKAVNIVQNPDGKVYVLYQHDTRPLIMRYDFDGTALSNGKLIYEGVTNLGKTPLGMIFRTNKRLLVGRPDIGALVEILLKSSGAEQTDFYKKTAFAKDLTALIAEPSP